MTTSIPPRTLAIPLQERARAAVADSYDSRYLQYLPAVYRQDPFLRQLLLIFETVLAPLENVVDTLPLYTEPELAPDAFLPWLAHWVGISLDSAWPLERQRVLIANAVEIYRWRGTRYGLKLHVHAYTGIEPLIQEYHDGFVLGAESGLGWTTYLTSTARKPILFTVTVPTPDPDRVDPEVLRTIIDEDKPAHATYRLRIVRSHVPAPAGTPAHNGQLGAALRLLE